MSLFKLSFDTIEQKIEDFLDKHIRVWGSYNYFIVDDYILYIKVFDENNNLIFTVKTALYGDKLQIVEVS